MKRILKKAGFLGMLVVLMTSPVWGRGTADVAKTIHNLSTTAPYIYYRSNNVDEVCVFCHTPHGGSLTGPLWNRSAPSASSFTHYNSVTLSSYLQGLSVTRDIGDESLLCMSCHDGSVAVDHLLNNPNSIGTDPVKIWGTTNVKMPDMYEGGPASRIGASYAVPTGTGILTDDHPISFSYSSVLADPDYNGGSKDGELRQIGSPGDANTALGWNGEGVRFFGSDNRVECSSCHDPHVDYVSVAAGQEDYAPFLIRPNTGSNLCLACHNK